MVVFQRVEGFFLIHLSLFLNFFDHFIGFLVSGAAGHRPRVELKWERWGGEERCVCVRWIWGVLGHSNNATIRLYGGDSGCDSGGGHACCICLWKKGGGGRDNDSQWWGWLFVVVVLVVVVIVLMVKNCLRLSLC